MLPYRARLTLELDNNSIYSCHSLRGPLAQPPTQARWTGMLSIVLKDGSLVSPSLDSSLPPQPAWSQVTPGEMNEYPGSVGLVATDGL